jgi:hypothetical protein
MSDRLYFVTRDDLTEGRRAAQLLHAMDLWTTAHGPQGGTVIVYSVPDEDTLLACPPSTGRTVLWREPDLNDQATAFASDAGRMDLPLLGRRAA